MLRCRFAFIPQADQLQVYEHTDFLPRLLLVQRCRVLGARDEIFAALASPTFNAREEVILEDAPDPQPAVGGEAGTAGLLDSSSDQLTIDAEVKSPAILLITDTYAKGWRARALPGSSQRQYRLMPANYCLRAIPLAAGHHRLRVEYLPSGFVIGQWTSSAAAILFFGLAGWRGFKPRAQSGTETGTSRKNGLHDRVETQR
jgi:hypothetical protein